MDEILHFKVSSGLKNIIGQELINDKYIAIFELVKNSYDAGAHNVRIRFSGLNSSQATIAIIDDGCGMDKEGIINKWLFVAYSEKRNASYRDRIKRAVAGAKGVGRFSCDRLGENVVLESKIAGEPEWHTVAIKWGDFEKNSLDNFSDIEVAYKTRKGDSSISGTSITISKLREEWSRLDLLSLKKALAQLVNPSSTSDYDPFGIILEVPDEIDRDKSEKEDRNRLNGRISNDLFNVINKKTIRISVRISEDGKTISSELIDRDVFLFKIVEKNEFSLRNISCELFFLNLSAKNNFKRIMGVDAIKYGSIFVYKNGFRIYPYGEPGQDFFDIDQRKQQGYKRFLGTRELIGRIEINGDAKGFVETSSRNNGFINSPYLDEFKVFFMEYTLKPLEKYIINIVQWGVYGEFLDSAADNPEFEDIKQIVKKIKTRSKAESYLSIDCNQELRKIISDYYHASSPDLTEALRKKALEANDNDLLKQAEAIEKHTHALKKHAQESDSEAQASLERLDKIERKLSIAQKQVGLLEARADLTAKDAIDAMHIMKSYADTIDSLITEIYEVSDEENIQIDSIRPYLRDIGQTCEKIMNSYNLVVRTKYSANSDNSHEDIIAFIVDYFGSRTQPISVEVIKPKNVVGNAKYNPLEFSIVLDNLISNSSKANASKMLISFEQEDNTLIIHCVDDGYGLNPAADVKRLFEPGYTTTLGSGIGMSTIKKYIEKSGGRVAFNPDYRGGFEVILYLRLWT